MTFLEYLKQNIVCLDGGMGTLLQAQGLGPGEQPERWNLSRPEVVRAVHKAYYDAGSNVVSTNTFGANVLKFSESELEEIVAAAVANAKAAREESTAPQEKFVALDIGPTGKLLAPLGTLDFEDAVETFAKTVRLGVRHGVDLILIETMNDSYETKAALLAAKENSTLPVLVSNAYSAGGKLMTGASPAAMAAMLEGMGADAIGANCSLGPHQLRSVAEELLANASVPVLLKPNAGLPKVVDGETVFDVTVDEFAAEVARLVEKGLRVMGGCCGTTPDYIRALTRQTAGMTPVPVTEKNKSVVSSHSHTVELGKAPVSIGWGIDPAKNEEVKQALLEDDMDTIVSEGIDQQDDEVDILNVHVGLDGIDEAAMLREAVCELQVIVNLPLQIDSRNAAAVETALRRYNGKAMVRAARGDLEAVLPLVKKYGGLMVVRTEDAGGAVPEAEADCLSIAREILHLAEKHGIRSKDVVFENLAMRSGASIAEIV